MSLIIMLLYRRIRCMCEVHFKIVKKISPIIFFIILFISRAVLAGPPFLTDDPDPVDYKHLELYFFSAVVQDRNDTEILAPALEVNWGALPNTQVSLTIPFVTNIPRGAGGGGLASGGDEGEIVDGGGTVARAVGWGDITLGVKYRFLQETKTRPQVAIYPAIGIPTGDAQRDLGNGKILWSLPIWVQKSWGKWTTYGGGGFIVNNQALGARSFPFGGWEIQREINDKFTLGAEVFAQGKSDDDTFSTTILNAGAIYKLNKHFALMFSIGHSVAGAQNFVSYVALNWTNQDENDEDEKENGKDKVKDKLKEKEESGPQKIWQQPGSGFNRYKSG